MKRMGADGGEDSIPNWLQKSSSNTGNKSTSSASRSTGFLKKSNRNESYGSTNSNNDVQVDYGEDNYSTIPAPSSSSSFHLNTAEFGGLKSTPDEEENKEPTWLDSNNDERNGRIEQEQEEEEEEESSEEEEEDSSDEEEESSEDDDSDEEDDDDSDDDYPSEHDKLIEKWSDDNYKSQNNNKMKKKNNNKNKTKNVNKRPMRNCCHSFFILVQMIAILGNLSMIAIQLIPVFAWDQMIIEHKLVRFYISLFDFVFILSEFEIYTGLNNWVKRGVVYTFVGVVALDQRLSMIKYGFLDTKLDTSMGQTWNELWTNIFIEVVSWWMIGVGCAYILLGLLCMKSIRNRCRVDYQKRLKEFQKKMKSR